MELCPWPSLPSAQGIALRAMHKHVGSELVAYLVAPSNHGIAPMAS